MTTTTVKRNQRAIPRAFRGLSTMVELGFLFPEWKRGMPGRFLGRILPPEGHTQGDHQSEGVF